MFKAITLSLALLVALVSTQTCQPNYWECDPGFAISTDDLSYVASQPITLQDIQQTKGLVPGTKTTYQILNITTSIVYDGSQKQTNRSDTAVTVRNVLLNFVFNYKAHSKNSLNSSKKYDGKATAHLTSISVTYTKSALIKNGLATFEIKDVVITNTSVITPNGDYDPSGHDHEEFDNMIKTTLTAHVIAYYKTNIPRLLTEAISTTNIPYTFVNQPYVYEFGGYSVSINTSATNLSMYEQGYLIGYAGIVEGKQSNCSQFVPENTQKASYIAYGLISNIFDSFYTGSKAWQGLKLDQKSKTPLFNFYMIDIEQIIPQALTDFPQYFDKIYVTCSIDNTKQSQLNFLQLDKKINTTLTWNCGLFRQESDTLFSNFAVTIDNRVVITQVKNTIQVKLQYSRLSSATFTPVGNYAVVNQDLARMYIASVVSGMEKQVTVGSGFLQPQRDHPVIDFSDENSVVKISETGNRIILNNA